tara:strand:- start:259 stop:609 length:351 start_codon:yes stop_codon:yes gene_type:complete
MTKKEAQYFEGSFKHMVNCFRVASIENNTNRQLIFELMRMFSDRFEETVKPILEEEEEAINEVFPKIDYLNEDIRESLTRIIKQESEKETAERIANELREELSLNWPRARTVGDQI